MPAQPPVPANPNELLQTVSSGYDAAPISSLYNFAYSDRFPTFDRYIFVPQMWRDPRIRFGSRIIKGTLLSNGRFFVDDPQSTSNDESGWSPVKRFVVDQINYFWQTSAIKALTAIEWGFSASEVLYRLVNGRFEFDGLKPLAHEDVNVWERGGTKTGVMLYDKHDRDKGTFIGGMKSLWHVHEREHDQWYGCSRLEGAFRPWHEFSSEKGANDVRRLFNMKYAFNGDTGRYPPGRSDSDVDPYGRYNRDIMLEILEKRTAGGTVALPGTKDAEGNYLWDIVPGGNIGQQSGAGIEEWVKTLRREMWEGMGIPEEVVLSLESGAWNARMISHEAFLSTLQDLAYWLIQDFDTQVLRPLVYLNFHQRPTYRVIPFSLLFVSASDQNLRKQTQETVPEKPTSDDTQSQAA